MNYEKIEEKRYEKFWSSLKGKFSSDPEHYTSNVPYPAVIKFIKYLKKMNCTGKALDIGCGNGRHAVIFAKNKFSVSGIDVSKSAIKITNKNAKENKVNISTRIGSVLNLPYQKDSFDVLLDSGCLHHLRKSQWKQYLKNILLVLKKGRYFLLICFSKNSRYIPEFSPKSKNRNWTLRNGHYNHFFTNKEIKETFSNNFEIINTYEIKKRSTPLILKVFLMKKK